MLSLKTHNILDYVIAFALISIPFLFGFSEITSARNTYLILGAGLAAYSLMTKYYYCIARIIPVGVHMIFDAAAGFVVMTAPFLMGYRDQLTNGQLAIHFVMGIGAIGLVAITRTRSEAAKTLDERKETVGIHFDRMTRV